jgi:hypothetical protein
MRHTSRNRARLLLTVLSGGGGFSPSFISGYTIDYDFADTSTLYQDSAKTTPVTSDNDVIGAVENKANPGTLDATQGTTASKPVWRSGGYAEADGTDDALVVGSLTSAFTSAATGFILFNMPGTDSNDDHVWIFRGATGNYHWGYVFGSKTDVYDGFMSASRSLVSTTAGVAGTHIVTARNNGTNLLYRIDGNQTYDAANSFLSDTGSLFNNASSFSNGSIYRVILYNRALSTDEITQVENYLNSIVSVF